MGKVIITVDNVSHTIRIRESGMNAGMSYGSLNKRLIVFTKITNNTTLSHHGHSIAAIEARLIGFWSVSISRLL
jgi:hypothetical protein